MKELIIKKQSLKGLNLSLPAIVIPIGTDTFAPENLPLDRIVFDRNDKGDVVAMKDYYNGHFMGLRNKEVD